MGGLLILGGVLLVVTGVLGRIGRLPRNHIAGFRTRTTMASDDTWLAAHRAGGPLVATSGLIVAVLGVAVLGGANDDVLGPVAAVVITGFVIPGGLLAQRAARTVGDSADQG